MRSFRAGLLLSGLAVAAYSATTASLQNSTELSSLRRTNSLVLGPSVERLVVFLGSSACRASTRDSLRDDLRILGGMLHEQDSVMSVRTFMIGVSTDYDVVSGTEYLTALYPFDEITVGRGFLNVAVSHFLLGQAESALAIPQILVIDRQIHVDSIAISVGPSSLVRRVIGADSIHAWVSRGAIR